jgi:glutaredoxin 3
MTAAQVVMYRTGWCGYCARAKRLLQSKQVAVEEIDIETDPRFRATMQQRSGRSSVPQIFIGERHVGGYDDLKTLDDAGKLDALLRGENV